MIVPQDGWVMGNFINLCYLERGKIGPSLDSLWDSLPWSEFALSLLQRIHTYVPGSKLLVLGMVIQPLIGNPYNGYINPYYWVDDRPLLYLEIMGVDRPDRTYSGLSRIMVLEVDPFG